MILTKHLLCTHRIRHYRGMSIKRVAINISLPDEQFKASVEKLCYLQNTTPSKEFVAMFKNRIAKLNKIETLSN